MNKIALKKFAANIEVSQDLTILAGSSVALFRDGSKFVALYGGAQHLIDPETAKTVWGAASAETQKTLGITNTLKVHGFSLTVTDGKVGKTRIFGANNAPLGTFEVEPVDLKDRSITRLWFTPNQQPEPKVVAGTLPLSFAPYRVLVAKHVVIKPKQTA